MARDNKAAFENYWSVILRAGQAATREGLLTLLNAHSDALDEGALATMSLLAGDSLHMEKAFTTLDSAKGIGMRHLTIRSAAAGARNASRSSSTRAASGTRSPSTIRRGRTAGSSSTSGPPSRRGRGARCRRPRRKPPRGAPRVSANEILVAEANFEPMADH